MLAVTIAAAPMTVSGFLMAVSGELEAAIGILMIISISPVAIADRLMVVFLWPMVVTGLWMLVYINVLTIIINTKVFMGGKCFIFANNKSSYHP